MAGNYMNSPSDRLAWDRDGSILTFVTAGGAVANQTVTTMRAINGESGIAQSMGMGQRIAVVFPIPMDCAAVFFATEVADSWTLQTSKDTTNGLDGAWDSQSLINLNAVREVKPSYRTLSMLWALQGGSVSQGLRGIRITTSGTQASGGVRALHLYGVPASTATQDRLEFWEPTNAVRVSSTHFDWGNVPRSSSADKSFRIKNKSAALTANQVAVYAEALTTGAPSVVGMHLISSDGGVNFGPSVTIASLGPGALSPVLILRRVIPANAQVSVWSARVAADVNVWS